MLSNRDFALRDRALARVFEAQLGVKSRNLSQALRRAGRRLPRPLRKQGAFILQAQQLAGNPKLARQVNPRDVDKAYSAITNHLEAIDVADERKGRWLNLAGIIAANFLIVVAAFVLWLWWFDYV